MSKYFQYFPKIRYGAKVMTDITKGVRFFSDIENDPYAYLPYTVKEGESPEEVANLYYGSTDHVWVVYHSNQIIDPYFQWPMSTEALERTIQKKYKAAAEASIGQELSAQSVLQWTQNSTSSMIDNIVYYYDAFGVKINADTYANGQINSNIEASDWTAMRIYDEELRANEALRDIQLLNREYLNVAVKNLKRSLNV